MSFNAPFIFGGNTDIGYDDLKRRQEYANGMMQRGAGGRPKNAIEGINSAASSVLGALMTKKLGEKESEERDKFESVFQGLIGGGGIAQSTQSPVTQGTQSQGVASMPIGGESIKEGLMARGLPEHVAEGFVMNFQDESGLNPGINEIEPLVPGSRGGFGLSQWTGPRRKQLEAFAAQNGKSVADPNLQMDFLMTELQGSESNAAKSIFATQDAGQAAAAIVNKFLRPAESHRARRVAKYTGGQGYTGARVSSQGAQSRGIDPALLKAMTNPYASDNQKSVLSMLVQQQMQANAPMDPLKALQIRKMEQELDRGPERKVLQGADGFQYYQDDGSRVLPNVDGKPATPTTSQRDYNFYSQQEQASGREPLSFNEWDLQSRKAGAGATTINNELGNQSEFDKVTGKKLAETTQEIVVAGDTAQRSLIQLDRLSQALDASPQGAAGALSAFAGRLGVKTEGSSELEVAEAIISQLVPAQRPPGSGTMSDADLALFKKSLPSIINTPEGNKRIIETIRSIADYDIQRGEIAAQLQFGEIGAKEAREKYRKLTNPLQDFRGTSQPETPQAEQGGFEAFSQNQSAIDAAEKYGVSLEEMWAIKQGQN